MPCWADELQERLAAFSHEQLKRSFRAMQAAHKRRGYPINKITLEIYKEEYQFRGIPMPK